MAVSLNDVMLATRDHILRSWHADIAESQMLTAVTTSLLHAVIDVSASVESILQTFCLSHQSVSNAGASGRECRQLLHRLLI